jgi:hypothetical protein
MPRRCAHRSSRDLLVDDAAQLSRRLAVGGGTQLAEHLDGAADAQHGAAKLLLSGVELRLKAAARVELRAELGESKVDEVAHESRIGKG